MARKQQNQEQQLPVIRIGDAEYRLDDLTLNELSELEDVTGSNIDEMNFGSVKVLRHLAFLMERRRDPNVTVEDVGSRITMRSFLGGDNPPA